MRDRVGTAVLLVVAVGALIGLGFSAVGMVHGGEDAAAFAKAPACGATTGANSDCIRWENGTALAKRIQGGHPPRHQLDVTVSGSVMTLDFPADGGFLGTVAPRDALRLGLWHGTVTTVEDHGRRGPTTASPEFDYRSDKALAVALLGLAMLCVPLWVISILRQPSEVSRRHPWLVFAFTFSPLAGIIVMISAAGLDGGMSDLGTFGIAGALLALVAGLAWRAMRYTRRSARRPVRWPAPPPRR